MNRYIIKSTPKDFYFEERNFRKLIDSDVMCFAIPINDYSVGDLITFDYGVNIKNGFTEDLKEKIFPIQKTYKIDRVLPQKENNFFAFVAENGLVEVAAHRCDHTKLPQEEQDKIIVREI